jgi:hypothetical protein
VHARRVLEVRRPRLGGISQIREGMLRAKEEDVAK